MLDSNTPIRIYKTLATIIAGVWFISPLKNKTIPGSGYYLRLGHFCWHSILNENYISRLLLLDIKSDIFLFFSLDFGPMIWFGKGVSLQRRDWSWHTILKEVILSSILVNTIQMSLRYAYNIGFGFGFGHSMVTL